MRISKKIVLVYSVLAVIIFFVLFFSNTIETGDRKSIVDSNEYYTNVEKWEIRKDVDYAQTFTYSGNSLYSFSLKYAIIENIEDAKWEVKLINMDSETIIQQWEETVSELNGNELKEYVLEKSFNEPCDEFKIEIKSLTVGTTGVFLVGSSSNSLLTGDLLIDNQVQEGDFSIILSEIRSVNITVFYGIVLSIIIAGFLCYLLFTDFVKNSITIIKKIYVYLKNNKYKILRIIMIFIVLFICSIGVEVYYAHYKGIYYNWIRQFFWFVLGSVVIVFWLQKKYLSKQVEIVICTVLAFVGLIYIFGVPAEAEISWDEAIHYWRAVSLSHANTGTANYAECYLYWHSGIPYGLPNNLSNLENAYNSIQSIYNSMTPIAVDIDALSDVYIIAYIPAAVFLKIGRVIQLPYWLTFKLGIVANFMTYLVMIYMAVKKVKSGKMIITVCATIGTAFFLSTVYSADWWIYGWFMVAIAYFISCMQKQEKITKLEIGVIVVASFLAFLPKAIYFPLLIILMLMPEKKFIDKKQYYVYLSAIIASMGVLVVGVVSNSLWIVLLWGVFFIISYPIIRWIDSITQKQKIVFFVAMVVFALIGAFFVIKYLFPIVFGTGDIRGGSDVDSAQQIRFIFENPIQYVKIVYDFLTKNYLVFEISWKKLFNTLGYLGATECHVIALIFLIVISITDKSSHDLWKEYNYVKWIYIVICFFTICLIVTALYISFTPVGYGAILGVQQRYLLPMFVGFFALIGSNKIDNKMNRTIYNFLTVAICALILLSNIWNVVICNYV